MRRLRLHTTSERLASQQEKIPSEVKAFYEQTWSALVQTAAAFAMGVKAVGGGPSGSACAYGRKHGETS